MSCVLHSAGVLAFGFGLAAAGVLPRLEYNALSNLAGGYPGGQAEGLYGWAVRDWGMLLEAGSSWYTGVTVLAFAVVAPLVAWRHFAVPYFAIIAPCALVLSGQGPTPLHSILYQVLPYFERLHPHRPERVMVVFYLAVALLAGAALTELGRRATKKAQLLVPPAVVVAVISLAATSILLPPIDAPQGTAEGWQTNLSFLTTENGSPALVGPLLALASVTTTLVLGLVPVSTRLANQRGLALTSVALLAFVDLFGAGRAAMAELSDWKGLGTNELATNYDATGAAEFLRSREGAFRYASYAEDEWSHNSAMMVGLEQVQGYNPLRLASYDEYMNAMNGFEQNYHFASPYEDAFSSPLFDLLNARYVVIPTDTAAENQEWLQRALDSQKPPVYEDTRLKVIENPEALPRAWIVHSTRQVRSGQEALDLLSAGQVDPRETALLAEDPPEQMSQPDDPSAEWASITEHSADSIQLQTVTETPGLLVLSEVYYPAWKAYVDGHPVPVYPTNQLLRSVPIPAGDHTVELRYESWAIRVGLAISLVAFAVLAVLVTSAAAHRKSAGGKGTAPVRGGLR